MHAVHPLPSTSDLLPEAGPARASARARRTLGLVLLACLTAQAITAIPLLSSGGFWSPDSAVRFVQMESLERAHFREVSISYPAFSLDPLGRFFPFGPWFHFVRGGKYYLSYPPYFPAMTAPFFHFLALPGLIVLPMAAGLGAALVVYRVLQRREPGLAPAGTLAFALATPLVPYCAVYWDHTLVVVLSAGGLALALGALDAGEGWRASKLVLAGALLGCGLWLRNEMYVLILAFVVAWLWIADRGRVRGLTALLAGLAVPAGLVWALNYHLVGSPLGWKGQDLVTGRVNTAIEAAGRAPSAWVGDKLGNLYYQLVSPDYYAFNPQAVAIGVSLVAGLLLAGLLLRVGVARRSSGLVAVGGVVGVIVGSIIVSSRTVVSGLLPSAPFLVLLLLPGPLSRSGRFLWGVVGAYTVALIITGTHGGLQWGPRYLLPILPALLWLTASAVGRVRARVPDVWPALRLAAGSLLAVSVLLQASGVDQVSQAMARNALVNEALRDAPADVVVTPLEWLTLGAGPVYFEKTLMLVRSPEEFHALVAGLSARHAARWTYIPFSGSLFAPAAVERWVAERPWHFRMVDDRIDRGLRLVTFAGSGGPP